MARVSLFLILLVVTAAPTARGAYTLQIGSFNSMGTAQSMFSLGDTITIRVRLFDLTVPAPDVPNFVTDNPTAFNLNLVANTNDANEVIAGASGTEIISSEFEFSPLRVGVAFDDMAGRTYSGLSFDGGLIADGHVLVEFSYMADVGGATVFDLGPGNTNVSFQIGGMGVPRTLAPTPTMNPVPPFSAFAHTVNVATAVPEPSSFALASLGLFGLGVHRRRRAQKKNRTALTSKTANPPVELSNS